jgi:signal transduction histidine kinase
MLGEARGPERDRGALGHVPRVVFVGDESQKTDRGARRGIDIDLTDEPAPSDFPVIEFLREQLVQLCSQNRELSDRVEKERHRVAPLERALVYEAKRAAEADAQVKKLQRRLRDLEKKPAKLRSETTSRPGVPGQRELKSPVGAADLAHAVFEADAVRVAVQAATRFVASSFSCPAVGWLSLPGDDGFALASACGFSKDRPSLVKELRRIKPGRSGGHEDAAAAFARVAGIRTTTVLDAGDALLFAAVSSPAASETLATAEPLLRAAIEHLRVVEEVDRKDKRLDMALWLTAHELRGPLSSARMMLEAGLENSAVLDDGALRSTIRDLLSLTDVCDAFLSWAIDSPGYLAEVDVFECVYDAIDSCAPLYDVTRVIVTSPERLIGLSAPHCLRVAVANVLNNAFAYSPSDGKIDVTIERDRDVVRITIGDEGPGIPPSERDEIFNPFFRGARTHATRDGKGLGLFVSRRALEAQGGTITVLPSDRGAHFQIELRAGPEAKPYWDGAFLTEQGGGVQ